MNRGTNCGVSRAGAVLFSGLAGVLLAVVPQTDAAYESAAHVINASGGHMENLLYQTTTAVGQGHGLGFNSSASISHYAGFIQRDSSGNDYAPVLAPIGQWVAWVSSEFEVTLCASDQDGIPPSVSAEWLPTGAVLQDHGNGCATLIWTPESVDHGVHGIRITASDGIREVTQVVRLYVGGAEEDADPQTGLPESLVTWSVPILSIEADPFATSSLVEWESKPDVVYDMYGSDDGENWSVISASVAADDDTVEQTDNTLADRSWRFYQVVFEGETPSSSAQSWSLARSEVQAGTYSMYGSPARSDRKFDGQMGTSLASVLTGHNSGIGTQTGDEVYVLESDGNWRMLYLDTTGVWRESDGSASYCELEPGQGFFVARFTPSSTQWSMAGEIDGNGTGTATIREGWNILNFAEGRPVNLNNVLGNKPSGGASEEQSDLIVVYQSDGSWRRYMYIQGWGAPYDGKWWDLDGNQIVQITNQPGRAFYYYRKPGAGQTTVDY